MSLAGGTGGDVNTGVCPHCKDWGFGLCALFLIRAKWGSPDSSALAKIGAKSMSPFPTALMGRKTGRMPFIPAPGWASAWAIPSMSLTCHNTNRPDGKSDSSRGPMRHFHDRDGCGGRFSGLSRRLPRELPRRRPEGRPVLAEGRRLIRHARGEGKQDGPMCFSPIRRTAEGCLPTDLPRAANRSETKGPRPGRGGKTKSPGRADSRAAGGPPTERSFQFPRR
jgi:hypothetical protein